MRTALRWPYEENVVSMAGSYIALSTLVCSSSLVVGGDIYHRKAKREMQA